MAKRRKVAVPSEDDLNQIEERFRRETSTRSGMAPISQISADAALASSPLDVESRAANAKLQADSDALQTLRSEDEILHGTGSFQEVSASNLMPFQYFRFS